VEQAVTHLIGASRLKELLGVRSWYTFTLLRHRGVIPLPDANDAGRDLWKLSRLQAIKDSIEDYEMRQAAAKFNAPISV
jgi:hypothetical protein